jgi:hypothetical protein
MKVPNLPKDTQGNVKIDPGVLTKAHQEMRRLVEESPDARRLANMIIRFALNGTSNRIGTIPAYKASVIVNALEPADGFEPEHLEPRLAMASLLSPDVKKTDKATLAAICLRHPDAQTRGQFEVIVMAQFSPKEFVSLKTAANEKLDQSRRLGKSDSEYLDYLIANGYTGQVSPSQVKTIAESAAK